MDMKAAAKRTLDLARYTRNTWQDLDPSLGIEHLESMLDRWPEHSDAKAGRWLGWLQAAVVAGSGGQIGLEDMKVINTTSQPRVALSPDACSAACRRVLRCMGDETGYSDPMLRIEPTSGNGYRVFRARIPFGESWLGEERLVAEADQYGKIRALSDPEGIVGGAMIEALSDFDEKSAKIRPNADADRVPEGLA